MENVITNGAAHRRHEHEVANDDEHVAVEEVSEIQRRLLEHYFFNRTDTVAFADSLQDRPNRTDVDGIDGAVRGHVQGQTRIGSYCLSKESKTRWTCIDFDGKGHACALADVDAAALKAQEKARALGLESYLEKSGKGRGWHLWIFYEEPIPGEDARHIGLAVVPRDALLDDGGVADPLANKGIEVFPKQAKIADGGFGNMLWLPFYPGAAEGGNLFYRKDEAGVLEVYQPRDFVTVPFATAETIAATVRPPPKAKKEPQAKRKSSGEQDGPWKKWRTEALAALPLNAVYGEYLTGKPSTPGWLGCRDPGSPSGDRTPSAGVADGSSDAERGSFHSFREEKTISVFDFLIEYGGATDFMDAAQMVADWSGVSLPEQKKKKLSPREWFAQWAERNAVTYSHSTERIFIAGKEYPLDAARAKASLDAAETKGPGEEKLKHSLTEWLHGQREATKEAHRLKLAYAPHSTDQELRRYVRALTGDEETLDLAVVKHFIWQVKRKLHGIRVEHHLMPILHGKSRGGKSRAMEKLIEPVRELTDFAGDLAFLNDARESFRLTRASVIVVDEMAHAEKVCVNALKNRITSETVNWRALGLNVLAGGTNTATFIGATNDPVQALIYDPTGMRRFYEIKCLDHLDWETINSIDAIGMWQSVDHASGCPIVPLLDALTTAQEELRAKDLVEEWVDECCAVCDGYVSAKTLYENFVEYWQKQERKPWAMKSFSTKLTQLVEEWVGPEGEGWKKSNGKKYRLRLKPADGVSPQEEFFHTRRGRK